jgi:tetratricopeptide (TPR) repeat protein
VNGTVHSFSLALTNKAYACNERGAYQKAVETFERVIQMKPDSLNAWFGKGLAHLELKEYWKSIYCYQQVVRQDPSVAGTWNNSAICYGELGCKKAAIRRYKKAIELQLEQKISISHSCQNLVWTFEEMGRFKDALLAVDFWLKHFPDSKEAREVRALIFCKNPIANLVHLKTRTRYRS